MKIFNKFNFKSLYFQLSLSIIISILLGLLLFYLLQYINESIVFSEWGTNTYASNKLEECVCDLQDTISDHSLTPDDYSVLNSWADDHYLVYFYIVRDSKVIYDSSLSVYYSLTDPDEAQEYMDTYDGYLDFTDDSYLSSFRSYTLNFSDGEATLYIYGDFQYSLYTRIGFLNVAISSIFTILLLAIFIRNKIRYINLINRSIKVLEGGNLNYPIPVKGQDELTQVATSLNSMRIALAQQMENEKKALRANSSLVTALSHDLRTPLTTQMGYLEILKEHHYNSPEEMDKYIATALNTCNQIKEMSDRLFEYFLAFDPHPERPADKLEEFDGMELFLQIIMEHIIPLQNQGFTFDMTSFDNYTPDDSFSVRVNMDDILRVFNNIFSNIDKYADESAPVIVTIRKELTECVVTFSNKIRQSPRKNESSKIGLISISSLMKRQSGSSISKTTDDTFILELRLPIVPSQTS